MYHSGMESARNAGSSRRAAMLAGVKAFHLGAFLIIQTAILYLVYSGLLGQSDRRAALAAGIATGESAIYAGNGFRCPLTEVAENLGSEHGQVTDIFLPQWLASNIARIYVPLFALGLLLHARLMLRAHRNPAAGLPSGQEGAANLLRSPTAEEGQ